MARSTEHNHSTPSDRNLWFLSLRLAITLLLSGSGLLFLKPSGFSYSLLAIYGALGIIYFVYNVSARFYSEEFVRSIIIGQLIFELLIEGLLVNDVGGSFSPFILFFIISIVVAALYFRLLGSILVATSAGLLYSLPVFFDLSFIYEGLIEPPRLAGMGISSDEAFYTVFLHLCLFYFFSFISGYLAQNLFVTTRELGRLRLETSEILEQMRSGLLTVDAERRIVYFNKAAGEILELDPKDVRGRHILNVFGKGYREFQQRISMALDHKRAEDRSEISIDHPGGGAIPLGLSLSVIKDDEEKLRGVIAVFQDLTEAKKLEERIRATDRLAAVGQLAAGIAHEIRNPLASISGSVEVLKDELDPEGEDLRLMQLILKESSRLNTILTDFLNFARISRRSADRCDLGIVIPEVVELAAGDSRIGDSVEIMHNLHQPNIVVAGSEDQIKQILWNLILNSAQGMGQKGGVIWISTDDYFSEEGVQMIKLVVADNGPGISAGIRDKIFDPFFSTRQGGTGLGLPIVVRLVDCLEGKIDLESSAEIGTKFSICLPREHVKEKKTEILQEVTQS
jgi:two-component system sensor histidine kinase PilS (NtrC family)